MRHHTNISKNETKKINVQMFAVVTVVDDEGEAAIFR
jgi:hypothetical protein